MYHFIYKTTNTLNGMFYIGRHSTKDLNDGYLGSGKYLKNAIKKYGRENFLREILEFCNSSDDLWLLEEKYITREMISSDTCYNQSFGGINHIASLKRNNYKKFLIHQSNAGKKGGKASLSRFTSEEKTNWHRKGGLASSGSKGKTWILSEETKNKQKNKALERSKKECSVCGLLFTIQNLPRHLNKHSNTVSKLD